MTIKASMSFSDLDYDLFNTVLECCKKNAEIKYADRQRHNIVGRSVFGTQNQSGVNFQIILKDKPTGVEIYDYSKRGLDRKFADSLFNLLLPIVGEDADIKFEDQDECAICKKKFKLGLSRFIPSIGWATHSELCESCYTLLSSHDKNYCCICQKKLGIRKYSARIGWNRNLMLCKECYLVRRPQVQDNVTTMGDTESLKILKSKSSSSSPSDLLNKSVIVGTDDPLHILKIRFAKGEISKEEYQEMKRLLKDE
ncbi:MAG TPA: SHOCT domain-containing protein [Nitrososphaeraceae archaeon]|nr:SHOCT domain-containing protein [Nitrososphaeraceae archaeon]